MSNFRIEQDGFGTKEIANSKYYGLQTLRGVENLAFSGKSLGQYPEYIAGLALVKKAAAIVNAKTGAISADICHHIVQACDEIISGKYDEHFPTDVLHGGGGTSTNMNINEVIANIANAYKGEQKGEYRFVDPIAHINASQSTVDVCYSAQRIALLVRYHALRKLLQKGIAEFERKQQAFQNIETLSRTCLQDALPISLGARFSGYASGLKRRLAGLDASVAQMQKVNLGGTVIGSGWGASPEYRQHIVKELNTAAAHHFPCLADQPLQACDNYFDAAQNMDDLAEVSAQMALLARCLIKIAKDFRLLSSGPEGGFAEIKLPELQAGSTFFPGKVNPVIAETLIQSCFQIIGCDSAVQCALEHGEIDYNTFECGAGINVLDEMVYLQNSLDLFVHKCVQGVEANEARCKDLSQTIIPIVMKLKDQLGYAKVAEMMKTQGIGGIKAFYKANY